MQHAVIMAGGSGTRLWPLSRRLRPKQLMRLFGGKSLLQIAHERLVDLFAPENIWIVTSAHYLGLVREELPDVPKQNLIGEPIGRDTANAIGLAAALVQQRDPEAAMAVFTADHIITPQNTFAEAINRGLAAAAEHSRALVTFGITPTSPHTGYGYLHRGQQVSDGVYDVREFKEKPDQKTAEAYLADGAYYWNSGMFAWRTAAILREIETHLPDNHRDLLDIAANWGSPQALKKFESLKKISIDFGVMEQAEKVLVTEMACNWLDLGSWSAIAQTRKPDEDGNVAVAENAMFEQSRNNIFVAEDDHLIVGLGVEDLVVVRSGDATLICHRSQEQAIKQLVELRTAQFGAKYE